MYQFDNGEIACVDSLGEAKRLTVLSEGKLELVTDKGVFALLRGGCEPAYTHAFVIVILPTDSSDEKFLYFDPRITAALALAHFRHAEVSPCTCACGHEFTLPSENEAWEIIRTMVECPVSSVGQISAELTWVDIKGKPYTFDVTGFEQMPFPFDGVAQHLNDLDNRLWKLFMLSRYAPETEHFQSPQEFLEERNGRFLWGRCMHYATIAKQGLERKGVKYQ